MVVGEAVAAARRLSDVALAALPGPPPLDGYVVHVEHLEEAMGRTLDAGDLRAVRQAWQAQGAGGARAARLQLEASGFLCGAAVALAARVVGAKDMRGRGGETRTHLFVDEGFYGGLSAAQPAGSVLRLAAPAPREGGRRLLGAGAPEGAGAGAAVVWGPTCDSIDVVEPAAGLRDGDVRDGWLSWQDVGASGCYTARSAFNGIAPAGLRYMCGDAADPAAP